MLVQAHSHPQSPRSFWSAPGLETSGSPQYWKFAIHGLIVKSDKSDWLNKYSEQVLFACSEIGSDQRSRSPGADQKDRGLWGREWFKHYHLAPVVQRVDNAIYWMNRYPVDSKVCFANTSPLDCDLSGG